ncbi:CD9 antigen isoform X1 [Anguilla rostrata]|uniref:CD9 antigen isoform X1 n=1 Tax=Anguilla rostrata TaxID=7938 RepID=UPI0030CD31CC
MDDCGRVSKCFVILFNIVIAIVGFVMLALGLWLRFSSQTQGFFDIDLNTKQFVIGVTVLIALGIILLILAVLGHCGACSGSKGALTAYASLLGVLAGVFIAAGVLAYINSHEVGRQLAEFYKTVYLQYLNKGDPGLAATLKLFNNALDCCGIGVPLEALIQDTCPKKDFISLFTTASCPNAIQTLFDTNAPLVLGCFIGISIVMVFTSFCSCILSAAISRSLSSAFNAYTRIPAMPPAQYGSVPYGV